jgi:hypothetical protein
MGNYEIVLNIPNGFSFDNLEVQIEYGSIQGMSLSANFLSMKLAESGFGTGPLVLWACFHTIRRNNSQ